MNHMNNLTQRIVTAALLIVVLVALLFKTSIAVFATVFSVCGLLAVWELWRLVQPHNKSALVLMALAYSCSVLQLWLAQWLDLLWFVGLAHIAVTLYLLRYKPKLQSLLAGLYGSILLAVVVYSIIVLQAINPWVLLSAMWLVWVTDICGYFFGRSLGGKFIKTPLAPNISPKKSWEGAIVGALAATAITLTVVVLNLSDVWVIRPNARLTSIFVLPLLMAAYSITGDLVESLLKRQAGVKDSSQLLPGHGGILDRIDALIPVLPLCAAWAKIFVY
jgi:phosphatidate cytidylyltransferase